MTHADRDQVVEHIKTAFEHGRLDKDELDERLDQAMTAKTHADLAPLLADLYPPMTRQAAVHPGHRLPRSQVVPASASGERLTASAAHLLGIPTLFVGPLIMLLTAGKTSPYVRMHAAEALNFQLTVLIATLVLPLTIVFAVLIPFMWIAWFVLAVVGGVGALGGGRFRYPFAIRMIK